MTSGCGIALNWLYMGHRVSLSLKKKTVIVIVALIAVISVIFMFCFSSAVSEIIKSQYSTQCEDLANTVASSVNAEEVKTVRDEVMRIYRSIDPEEISSSVEEEDEDVGNTEYVDRFSDIEGMKEFTALRSAIRKIQDVNHMECIYLIYPDIETGNIVYLVDGSYDDVWHPGTLEPLFDSDFKEEGDIRSGFGTLMSNTEEYGALITTAVPVLDTSGQVIAYAGLDYSVEELIGRQYRFTLIVFLVILFIAFAAAWLTIRLVDKNIVVPINKLSEASVSYVSDGSTSVRCVFSSLDIHTGDEIETLADSMAKMERDLNDYIDNLILTRSELSTAREYAEKMEEDAYRDSLTGVRNKRSYDAAVTKLLSDISLNNDTFGIAIVDLNNLKEINDNYGHKYGDEAIRNICSIVCDVFAHSPVFRYGGDEFVVILQNQDLEHIEELIVCFRGRMHELKNKRDAEPWLRHTAAIGFAVYDPEIDHIVSNVFRRADEAMYADKLASKAAPSL